VGYFAELMTINEQVHESVRPLLRLSREIIRMRPRSGSPFRIRILGSQSNESKNEL
jgi:hypothetical protein